MLELRSGFPYFLSRESIRVVLTAPDLHASRQVISSGSIPHEVYPSLIAVSTVPVGLATLRITAS